MMTRTKIEAVVEGMWLFGIVEPVGLPNGMNEVYKRRGIWRLERGESEMSTEFLVWTIYQIVVSLTELKMSSYGGKDIMSSIFYTY